MRLLPVVALLALPASAQADVIISNLMDPTSVGTAFGSGASTQYKAFGFTMGSQAFAIDEVVLALSSTSAAPNPVVEIWSDAGGTPGMSLVGFDPPPVVTGTDDFVFTAQSNITLEAGTSYWVYVVSSPMAGDPFLWDAATLLPSGANATAIGYEFNGGSSSFFNRLEVRGTPGTGSLGTNYCTAQDNSTGGPASISAAGSATASDNDLTLSATGMPPMQFGIFLTSMTQAATPVASGTLCLGGNIIRFQGAGQILQADANGEYSLQIDTTALPAGVPTPINAGDTYSFTTWFRDVDPMTGNTANFSDGVEITFN